MRNTFTLALIFTCCLVHGQVEKPYQEAALKADINYLKTQLEQNHPSLYLYSEKNIIDRVFDSLINSIQRPMTDLEFYRHITILSSIIKDGHTIMLPAAKTTGFYNTNGLFFPYKLKYCKNKVYAEMVLTSNNSIPEGSEIISINQIPASNIFQSLTERQVRDGYNETYPTWIIDNYFREYYSYIFNHPAQFTIHYIHSSDTLSTTIAAMPKDSINVIRQTKYPEKSSIKKPNNGIVFNISGENVGYLLIRDFHQDVLKKVYKQDFKTEIRQAFESINEHKIENLVIDLRNNQGGEIEYGVYLLSYLLQENFQVVDNYYKVAQAGSDRLTKTTGESLGVHAPQASGFKGKLIVLINGGSFSNSGIVAAVLKKHNRAVFIGTETGGSNKVLAGYIKEVSLPNTEIQIEIPTKQFMLNENMPLTGHGTYPDFTIEPAIDDILSNRDVVKEFALHLLKEQVK